MKIKINYSIRRLFKDNWLYLLVFLGLILIFIIAVFFYFHQYQMNVIKIALLRSEIAEFNKKKELLNFKNQLIEDEVDLDYINQVLSQLVPVKEDFFSIIIALEKLSSQTNFIITSYNIVVDKSSPERLAIVIEGQGDPAAFLKFLQEYNFSGGRLITIDMIDFNQEAFTGSKVNTTFYTGKVSAVSGLEEIKVDMDLIQKILEKVQIDLKTEADISDYPTKSNPF